MSEWGAALIALLIALGLSQVAMRRLAGRIEPLRREHAAALAQLQQQLTQLQREHAESRYRAVPGVEAGAKQWDVLVGGERVAIRPLPPSEWLAAMSDLPEFLYVYAQERVSGAPVAEKELAAVIELARRWITASAVTPVSLDYLTLPEAEHALTHIAEINGITAHLREFFRERLATLARGGPDRSAVPN